jgi:hypothetical protein
VRGEFCVDPRKIQNGCGLSNAVIAGNGVIETERIEEPPLILIKPPDHRQSPPLIAPKRRDHCSPTPATDFCNKICQDRTFFDSEITRRYRGTA